MSDDRGFYAVIPAGGAGTRLWPLSRAADPKFLLDLTGSGRTLLQATWDRLAPLAGPGRTLVVTGSAHAAAVARQLPLLPDRDILVEPAPRDSAAAIGLAAAVLHERDPDAVLGSFAADHVVREEQAFREAVGEAVALAHQGYVVTIGIVPTHPATGFGYIREGEALDVPGAPHGRLAADFREKPDAETATRWLAEGGYRWNAGMFVMRAATLLDLLAEHQPDLHAGLRRIARAWETPDQDEVLATTWPSLTKIAIDHAVAEPAAAAGRVAVVPADLGWDDVGDWASLADLLPPAPDGCSPRVLGDPGLVTSHHSSGLVVPAGGRHVAVVGLEDVVVVDTPDAVLVADRARAQQVKAVVDALRAAGRDDLL